MDFYGKGPILEWDEQKCLFISQDSRFETHISEFEARNIMKDCINGLEYGKFLSLKEVHSMGIIHRDIKPQNILQDNQGIIKIGTVILD